MYHFFSNICIINFTDKAVLEPRVSPAFAITYFCNHCNIRFENTSKYVDTLTLFSKNLNQRSLTPRWPLTPCLLRSHVWLYPRIIASKSHDNTSMYVDTVINFAKYHIHTDILERFSRAGPRGRGREWATLGVHPLSWLLSNNRLEKVPFVFVLHTSSNRLLLSNQDKGCTPSVAHFLPLPLGPALLNLWITYYIHTTYYLQNEWSHSLLLNSVQARQKMAL